jgi:hypothetical protein
MEETRVFISYTSREEEVVELRPFMTDLLEFLDDRGHRRELQRWVWLDMHRLTWQPDRHDLHAILVQGIRKSQSILSCISPSYWWSEWCQFEYGVAAGLELPVFYLTWKDGNYDIKPLPNPHEKFDACRLVKLRNAADFYKNRDFYNQQLEELAERIRRFTEYFGRRQS